MLCEKPLSMTVDGVDELIAARDRTGKHIEEALAYRNHPQWQQTGELLAAGAIGGVRSVHATMAKRFLDPADIHRECALRSDRLGLPSAAVGPSARPDGCG